MNNSKRKHHTPEEKVSILRRHLIEKVPVSNLCEEFGLHPTVFYRWLKQFFENGGAAFQNHRPDSGRQPCTVWYRVSATRNASPPWNGSSRPRTRSWPS